MNPFLEISKCEILIVKVEYLSEDDDVADLKAEGVAAATPFYSSADGVKFHAESFMELNLSRPLLRACETLGYKKPTPIQVQFIFTPQECCNQVTVLEFHLKRWC